jgi:hypothetical protein
LNFVADSNSGMAKICREPATRRREATILVGD